MADPVNLHTYINVAVGFNLQDEILSTGIFQVLIRPIYIFQLTIICTCLQPSRQVASS